jgi:hypothetical protein
VVIILITMDHDEFEFEEVWDEFQWERFLQKQDEKTEKYFGLMEKFENDPDRDEIVAREMGWHGHPKWSFGEETLEETCAGDEAWEPEGFEDDEEDEEISDLESHPAFVEALFMHRWMDEMVEEHPSITEDPAFGKLLTRFAVCSAKLAAAISNEDEDEDETFEIGMIIAFLKRSLKAAHDCLQALETLQISNTISEEESAEARESLFTLRNSIVDYMGEMRAEWKRRYDNNP